MLNTLTPEGALAAAINRLNKRVSELEAVAIPRIVFSTANVSNPPTDAQLDAAFGQPAAVGAKFIAIIDDAGGHVNEYLVWSDGTSWFYVTGTKAV